MSKPAKRRASIGAAFFCIGLAAAAPAEGPRYAGLASIAPGRWQFHEPGSSGAGPNLCVADPIVLLQLGHPGAHCRHRVVADDVDGTTVHYVCPGVGQGRTALTVETPRLIHLKTEGMSGGVPFDYDYEGRRVGDCTR